jgi:tetratricopeptide (TPR) repeat protein
MLDCYLGLNKPVEARKAALKALALDPTLGEAHASLGFLTLLYDWDWDEAEAELRRGLELSPNCAQAHQWYGLFLAKMGRHEEAILEARKAQQLDPLSLLMNVTTGVVLYFARQYDRAIRELQRVIEMDANFASGHSSLGLAYMYRKMYDEAIREFQTASALSNGSSETQWHIKALTACCYATCGRRRQAKAFLHQVEKQRAVSPYMLGMIHAQLGDVRRAMDWLERAYQKRDVQLACLKVDPALDPLRSTRRFHSLMTRVGFAG